MRLRPRGRAGGVAVSSKKPPTRPPRARLLALVPGPWRRLPSHSQLGYRAVAVGIGRLDDLLDAFQGHVCIILRERLEDLVGGQFAIAVGIHLFELGRGQGLAHEAIERAEAAVAAAHCSFM